eukprot:g6439.t1
MKNTPSPSTTIIVEPEITLRSCLIDFVFFSGKLLLSGFLFHWGAELLSTFGDESKKKGNENRNALDRRLCRQGRDPIKTNSYENQIAGDLVRTEDLDVTFDMIGGLDKQKKEIYNVVVLPLKRPELFANCSKLLSPPNGVLLYGPPGTGKTMLAKAIAKESGATFINLKLSTMLNKWFGESNKLVRAVFTLAKKMAPTIIFIDEVDAFLRARASDDITALANMKAEFMALWDGLTSGSSGGDLGESDGNEDETDSDLNRFGVMVIGCSNRPYDIDDAILRRMPRAFQIDLPDAKQREHILKLTLREENLDETVDLVAIAALCDRYSGSDLKEVCRVAAYQPFDEFMRKQVAIDKATSTDSTDAGLADFVSQENEVKKPRPISQTDLLTSVHRVRPSARVAEEYRTSGSAESVRGVDRERISPSAESYVEVLSHIMRNFPNAGFGPNEDVENDTAGTFDINHSTVAEVLARLNDSTSDTFKSTLLSGDSNSKKSARRKENEERPPFRPNTRASGR